MQVKLALYDRKAYRHGAGLLKRVVWYFVNATVFRSSFFFGSRLKCGLLRLFGAKVGKSVVLKPVINIKYPWFLEIGDNTWLGEQVWIDNLAWVRLKSNVCISQGAYLLTGNHDYKDPAFALILGEVVVEQGGWVGARAVICPGVTMGSHSVLTVGSVLQKDALADGIYRGNPAVRIRERAIAHDYKLNVRSTNDIT